MTALVYPDWKEKIVYSNNGPQPQFLLDNDQMRVVLAGLEAGQKIPQHADKVAMYHVLQGSGWMLVDSERIPLSAGMTVIVPDGAARGIEAETRLAFLATRLV